MTTTLTITELIAAEIRTALESPVETAGVLMAGLVQAPDGDLRLVSHDMRWAPEKAYLLRTEDELILTSDAYVPALGRAERLGLICIWIHTHPGRAGVPIHSARDRLVDSALAPTFRLRTGSPFYGSAVFSMRDGRLAFTGSLMTEEGLTSIDRMVEVGPRLRISLPFNAQQDEIEPIYDRQVRAFGAAVQSALGELKVGVVGCGGTGSSVCEQLTRLGVRDFVLIDPDTLTESNLTRVYGSRPKDVGRFKVDILSDHICDLNASAHCTAIRGMCTLRQVAEHLSSCDVVFGCTDDNAGRLVLSRLSTYLLSLVIDCGVLLSSDQGGSIRGIDGRVTVLSPGTACLVCRGRIDMRRAASEMLKADERKRLEDEGYAPALAGVEPAVVAYTTAVASAAVGELLERLVGYGPDAIPSELLLRLHEREVSTNVASPRPGHYCDPSSGKIGLGSKEPFLEQVWPN